MSWTESLSLTMIHIYILADNGELFLPSYYRMEIPDYFNF